VIAIIAILASLLLPALSRARAMSKRATCLANLKQVGMTTFAYSDDYEEWGPYFINWYNATYIRHYGWGPDYVNDLNIWKCPTTDHEKLGVSQYPPGTMTINNFYSSYRLLFGSGDHSQALNPTQANFFGWFHPWDLSQAGYEQFRSYTPSLRHLGGTFRTTVGNRMARIDEAEAQPLSLDCFNERGVWSVYNDTEINRFRNNHPTFNGENIVFLDGHGEWRDMKSMLWRGYLLSLPTINPNKIFW
jgi:hypothetical protein